MTLSVVDGTPPQLPGGYYRIRFLATAVPGDASTAMILPTASPQVRHSTSAYIRIFSSVLSRHSLKPFAHIVPRCPNKYTTLFPFAVIYTQFGPMFVGATLLDNHVGVHHHHVHTKPVRLAIVTTVAEARVLVRGITWHLFINW